MFKRSLQSIAVMLRYARGATMIKLLAMALAAVLTPLSVYFTQRLTDGAATMVQTGALGDTPLWAALLTLSMAFSALGSFADSMLYVRMQRALRRNMTPALIERFTSIIYPYFEDAAARDSIHRMGQNPQDGMLNMFLNMTGVLSLMATMAGAALIYAQAAWWYAALFLILFIPMVWLDFYCADRMNTIFNNQSRDERRMRYYASLLSERASLTELRLYGAIPHITQKWSAISEDVLAERLRLTMRMNRLYGLSTGMFKVWSLVTVIALVHMLMEGQLTFGLFAALNASATLMMNTAEALSHSLNNISQRNLLLKHYSDFMEYRREERPAEDAPITIDEHTDIVFDDVSFTYPGASSKTLDGLTLRLEGGRRTALVGVNGAGKSTIVKLLLGLYKPDAGAIRAGGVPIEALSNERRRALLGVVFQDYASYSMTVRENIALGDVRKLGDDAALAEAARRGLAGDLLTLTDKGLDTPLGRIEDDGRDLSGGQWQRLAIARGVVSGAAFTILDEPTASLDPMAESAMYDAFLSSLTSGGALIISHRLASARLADDIAVLDGRRVAERGSHGRLMEAGGLYAAMYRAQSAWYMGEAGGASLPVNGTETGVYP